MAYRSPHPDGEGFSLAQPVTTIHPAESALSRQERTVVLLSRTDPLASIRDLSPVRRRLHAFFLSCIPNKLANPRLEALRRFAILLRVGREIGADEWRAFRAAGFNEAHVQDVREILRLGHGRPENYWIQAFWWSFLLIPAALGSFYAWQWTSDTTISLLVGMLCCVISLSLLSANARRR